MTLLSGFAIQQFNGANTPRGEHMGVSTRSNSSNSVVRIPIKFEEMFYNRAKEAYRVICIEYATTGPSDREGEVSRLMSLKTFDECKRYLNSDPVTQFVLTKMETSALLDFVAEFARGARTEVEIAKSTERLVDYVLQQLEIASVEMRRMSERKSVWKQLERIVETWTLGRVGPTIMSSLMQTFELMDREVHRVLLANQGLTLQSLQIRGELVCDFSNAIEMCSYSFDKVSSPVEKLFLLQDIIENIQRTIELSFSNGGKLSDNVLSSDDLIPIVVFVLVQSKPQHLNSTLYYVKHFTRTNVKTSQLGFHLTTFTAAAEFIKTDHLPRSIFGGSSSVAGDVVVHPLDPVRSPLFDPYAAGLQTQPHGSNQPQTHSQPSLQRRSTSYITPPVVQVGTGRSFGSKSGNSASQSMTTDYGYGYAPSGSYSQNNQVSGINGRSLSHSAAITDYNPRAQQQAQYQQQTTHQLYQDTQSSQNRSQPQTQKFHSRSQSAYESSSTRSPQSSSRSGRSNSPTSYSAAPRHSNYGSTAQSASPIYGSTATAGNLEHPLASPKGPETITLTPEESQGFFSNLKSSLRGSSRTGK